MDHDTVMLLRALSGDDGSKAAILKDIDDRMQALKAERAELDNRYAEVSAEAKKAAEDRAAAEAAKADAIAREDKLKSETVGLASAQQTHQREIEAFDAIRQKIDADHDAREEALKLREVEVAETASRQQRQNDDLASREATVAASEEVLRRRHEALAKAMAA